MQPCDKIVDDCIRLYHGGATSLTTIIDSLYKSNSTVLTKVSLSEPASTDSGFRARGEFSVDGMPIIRLVADANTKKGATTNLVALFMDKVLQSSPKYRHFYGGPQSWYRITKQIDAAKAAQTTDPVAPILGSLQATYLKEDYGLELNERKSYVSSSPPPLPDFEDEVLSQERPNANAFRVDIANVMPKEHDRRPIIILDCGIGATITAAHESAYHIIGFADNLSQLRPRRYITPQAQSKDGADTLAVFVAGMYLIAGVFDQRKTYVVSRDHIFGNLAAILSLAGKAVEYVGALPPPPLEKKSTTVESGRTRDLIIG